MIDVELLKLHINAQVEQVRKQLEAVEHQLDVLYRKKNELRNRLIDLDTILNAARSLGAEHGQN